MNIGNICTEQNGEVYASTVVDGTQGPYDYCRGTIHLPSVGVSRANLHAVVASEVQSALRDAAAEKASAKKCADFPRRVEEGPAPEEA